MQVERFVGGSTVIESGTVVVSRDELFTVEISGLRFQIRIINDPSASAVNPQRMSNEVMNVIINTANQVPTIFKFQVATLNGRNLYLAIHVEQIQNFHVIDYTFSAQR